MSRNPAWLASGTKRARAESDLRCPSFLWWYVPVRSMACGIQRPPENSKPTSPPPPAAQSWTVWPSTSSVTSSNRSGAATGGEKNPRTAITVPGTGCVVVNPLPTQRWSGCVVRDARSTTKSSGVNALIVFIGRSEPEPRGFSDLDFSIRHPAHPRRPVPDARRSQRSCAV